MCAHGLRKFLVLFSENLLWNTRSYGKIVWQELSAVTQSLNRDKPSWCPSVVPHGLTFCRVDGHPLSENLDNECEKLRQFLKCCIAWINM